MNNELKQKTKDNICETLSKCVHKELVTSDIDTLLITNFSLIKIHFFFKFRGFYPIKIALRCTNNVHNILKNNAFRDKQ